MFFIKYYAFFVENGKIELLKSMHNKLQISSLIDMLFKQMEGL